MSGTIPLSMTQQMDQYGDPLAGGLLYFFVAGTVSTFQNAYQDSALTITHPNPITLDATGRVPQLFLADGLIKIRLTDDVGVVQLVADNIQVIGASSGGGGGGAIDATTVAQTGDLKPRYGTGTHTGWVRCNGLTIGSATSGATERQNNDTQALFEYLWNTDPNLAVSGGRGANANADWVGNRKIALPDWRGAVIAGMDDMGSTAAGRLTATYFGADATVLGAVGGSEQYTLTQAQTPLVEHNHAGAGDTDDDTPDHTHPYEKAGQPGATGQSGFGTNTNVVGGNTGGATRHHHHINFTTNPSSWSGNSAHPNVQRTMVATIYIKL